MLESKDLTQFVRNYVKKVKCSTCEYVAIYVKMEGASTSKKRKEVKYQVKEGKLHWKHNPAFQQLMLEVQCYPNDDLLLAIFLANLSLWQFR